MVLFLVESVSVIYLYNIGVEMIDNENECQLDICDDYDKY